MGNITKIEGGTFSEDGHIYKDEAGIVCPSVTQILASVGLVDFSRVKVDVLEKKRVLGMKVHAVAEYLDTPEKGELDWDSVSEEAVGYVLAYERFCEETNFRSYPGYIEKSGIAIAHGMAFGYRLDRVGSIKVGDARVNVILELKCSLKEEPAAWPLQLAAYSMTPLPKVDTGDGSFRRAALQLRKDGRFKIFPYDGQNDTRLFLSALSLTHFKMSTRIPLPDVPDELPGEEEDGE